MAQEAKQGGRIVRRWVAECDFIDGPTQRIVGAVKSCAFNSRKNPTLHANAQAAVREAVTHAVAAGHIGGREVSVKRTYTPRTIVSEEVVE